MELLFQRRKKNEKVASQIIYTNGKYAKKTTFPENQNNFRSAINNGNLIRCVDFKNYKLGNKIKIFYFSRQIF